MKRILPILIIPLIFCQLLNSQSVVSKGKPFAEIFTDFHYNVNDTSKTKALLKILLLGQFPNDMPTSGKLRWLILRNI